MSDRELLEMAAKVAGIIGRWAEGHQPYGNLHIEGIDTGARFWWNPLTDDGDALQLLVAMASGTRVMCLSIGCDRTACEFNYVDHAGYPAAATRRAIVIAAAEIGKAIP